MGKGSRKTFPEFYSSYNDKEGTKLFSPRTCPLRDWEDKSTNQVPFDVQLPGAIEAAINPGWNFLIKDSEDSSRWQGNVNVQSGGAQLFAKYDEGNSYQALIKWTNHS